MRFIIPDGRERFYQWDTNQRLRCIDLMAGMEVHFSTPLAEQQDALVVESYEAEDAVWVEVPNELLRCPGVLTLYVYPQEGEEGHTAYETSFPILSREKPADYIYTPAELQRWEVLEARLAELEANGVPSDDAAQALETHNVDEEAHGDIRALIAEKLNSDELDTAVNAALAQAKASGQFDGAQGETGEQGPAGEEGAAGADGFSPVVAVEEINGGHRVTITDGNGAKSFDVMDGADGAGGSGSGVVVDATLTQTGQAADAAVVGGFISEAQVTLGQLNASIAQNAADIDALEEVVQQLDGGSSGSACECIEEVLAETELTFTAAGENLYVWQSVDTIVPLAIGKLYFVEFGGQTYECVGTAATFGTLAGVGIGNPAFAGLNDTGEPFLFGTALDGSFSACYCATGTGPYKMTVRATKLAGMPGLTSSDEDKILQVVDGKWAVVSLADSAVADYIDNYINEALGGEY